MTSLRIIWLLTVPAAVGFVMLGRQAIAILFEQGAFTATSTSLVYGVLVFFSVRIISEASLEILARLFFAQHDTKTPMYVALGWLLTTVSLSFILVDAMGLPGLALASTIAFSLQSITLYFLNRRRLGSLYGRQLLQTAGQTIAGAVGMVVVISVLSQLLSNDLALLLLGGLTGVAVYIGITYLAGSREIPALIRLVRTGQS